MTFRVILVTSGLSRVCKPLQKSKHDLISIVDSRLHQKKINLLSSLILKIKEFYKKDPLLRFCSLNNIDHMSLHKNSVDLVYEKIKKLSPDIIIIYSMPGLLDEKFLNIAHYGTVNLHPSILPNYAGPNPDFWQYYMCEQDLGVTVHLVTDKEDAGAILGVKRVSFELGENSSSRLDRLVRDAGSELLLEVLDKIEQNECVPAQQDLQSRKIRARRVLANEHANLIEWEEWSVERTWHVLRGTETWLNALPAPYGGFGQRWKIKSFRKQKPYGLPGAVQKLNTTWVVNAKDGIIEIEREFSLRQLLKFFYVKARKFTKV